MVLTIVTVKSILELFLTKLRLVKVFAANKNYSSAQFSGSDDVFIYGKASYEVTVVPEDAVASVSEWCTYVVGCKMSIFISKG